MLYDNTTVLITSKNINAKRPEHEMLKYPEMEELLFFKPVHANQPNRGGRVAGNAI
jgi:hypothetical protein